MRAVVAIRRRFVGSHLHALLIEATAGAAPRHEVGHVSLVLGSTRTRVA
jgi:hypothetical protein